MAKRIRRYVELAGGGPIPQPLPYAQLGEFAGSAYDSLTPTDQYGAKSDFNAGLGSALKGAGTGAAIGSVIPGVGTAVGAIVGGGIGAIKGIRDNNQAQAYGVGVRKLQAQQQDEFARMRLANYDQGSNNNQIYAKMGGVIPLNDDKFALGGNINKLSEENAEVTGNSHEQGGVRISPRVELEGGETVNKDFVFSEELGFAQRHKPIARAIGKMEKSGREFSSVTKGTIDLLKQKEEALKQEQETFKEQLGLKSVTKFGLGGETDPTKPTYVPLDPSKRFKTVGEHNTYYNDLAVKKFKSDSTLQAQTMPQLTGNGLVRDPNSYSMAKPIDANTAIILGGGIPAFTPAPPQRIVYGSNAPGTIKKLGVRPEIVKQGYNNGNGRLGVRIRR
jgi:hypothetical protein